MYLFIFVIATYHYGIKSVVVNLEALHKTGV